jgi:hypothetical protein
MGTTKKNRISFQLSLPHHSFGTTSNAIPIHPLDIIGYNAMINMQFKRSYHYLYNVMRPLLLPKYKVVKAIV